MIFACQYRRRVQPFRARALCAGMFVAASLLGLNAAASPADDAAPPEGARSLNAGELHALFAGKSWKWQDGAGLMQDKGRIFKAWSGSGDTEAVATGRWSVADSGLFCLKADWKNSSGVYPDTTCFRHKMSGRIIYQKREPDGPWYVFRHSPSRPSDEASRIVADDLVSSKIKEWTSKRSFSGGRT